MVAKRQRLEDRFQSMIAVRPLAQDVQKKVDLAAGGFVQHGTGK
jgi:hypothetical protein